MSVYKKLISFHPRLSAVLDAAVALLLLWWFGKVDALWPFLFWAAARPVWWVLLVQTTYYPTILSRLRHFFALLLFSAGATVLLVFVYTPWVQTVVSLIWGLIPAVSFWLIPKEEVSLSFSLKPLRRWLWLMSVIGLMGLWSGVYGSELFQLVSLSYVLGLILVVTLCTVLVSAWWWREYEVVEEGFFPALGILGLLVFEVAVSLTIWPAGYFISAFLVTWVWYVLWLMLRFSLTSEGIQWKRQGRFLIVNTVLLILYTVFVVRWK